MIYSIIINNTKTVYPLSITPIFLQNAQTVYNKSLHTSQYGFSKAYLKESNL